jgi:8-oxo-dGTP diphosphatase
MPHIHGNDEKDFTTSAFIVHPIEPKIILLKHNKLRLWLQPGGHVELNETPLQTLHHELEEETGLTPQDYEIIEPTPSPTTSGNNRKIPLPFFINVHPMDNLPTHEHIDLSYVVRAHTDVLTSTPDGASAIGWFTLLEVHKLYDAGD